MAWEAKAKRTDSVRARPPSPWAGRLVDALFDGKTPGRRDRVLLFFSVFVASLHAAHAVVYVLSEAAPLSGLAVGALLSLTLTATTWARVSKTLKTNRAAQEAAQAATQAKSNFLAMMSHEIRTPMNGILGLAQILSEAKLDRESQNHVAMLESSARALLVILNDVLDFSKIEAEKLALESIRTDLHATLLQAPLLMKKAAEDKKLELRVEIDEDLPRWALLDGARLGQVILNLLGNAVKFTEAGFVRLAARPIHQDLGICLRVEVEDTGIGIEEQALARMFEPFEQAEVSTTRRYGGTGLGLTISRRLVDLMGGTMGVESHPRLGSVFWFELPLEEAAPPVEPAATGASSEAATRSTPNPVLVVDDNRLNRIVAKKLLESLGMSVETASSGEEAVERVAAHDYALVLMDIQMPGIDGHEATRRIRQLPDGERITVVGLSANAMQGDREIALAAGMDDYLQSRSERTT